MVERGPIKLPSRKLKRNISRYFKIPGERNGIVRLFAIRGRKIIESRTPKKLPRAAPQRDKIPASFTIMFRNILLEAPKTLRTAISFFLSLKIAVKLILNITMEKSSCCYRFIFHTRKILIWHLHWNSMKNATSQEHASL